VVELTQVKRVVEGRRVTSKSFDKGVDRQLIIAQAAIDRTHVRVGEGELRVELGCGPKLDERGLEIILMHEFFARGDVLLRSKTAHLCTPGERPDDNPASNEHRKNLSARTESFR